MDTEERNQKETENQHQTAESPAQQQPTLGEVLHGARVAAGLSIRQASAASGVAIGTISMLERDKVHAASLRPLMHLSQAYGIAPLDIIEAAGYAPGPKLPPSLDYLRLHYHHIPTQAQQEIVEAIDNIATKHGLDLSGTGPAPGQDESEEPIQHSDI